MNDFIKAGKVSSRAREYARKQIKEGINFFEFAEKVENKIFSLGAKLAFPINISINEFAAHDTAEYKDKRVFESGQVVKVDLGAQVNGYVGDTAFTAEIKTKKYTDLIKASKEAFWEAIKIVRPGVKLCEIGAVINDVIKSHGYNPIVNLGGHGVGQYDLHTGIFVPNYDNGNRNKLKDGQTIAIEPFATTGKGRVVNSSLVKIHSLIKTKPTRQISAKKIMNYVKKEFNTLPFAERHLYKKFSSAQIKLGLRELVRINALYSYPLLKEQSNGIVSQYEHTIIVKDKPIITTL